MCVSIYCDQIRKNMIRNLGKQTHETHERHETHMVVLHTPLCSFDLRKPTKKMKKLFKTHERHETHETRILDSVEPFTQRLWRR